MQSWRPVFSPCSIHKDPVLVESSSVVSAKHGACLAASPACRWQGFSPFRSRKLARACLCATCAVMECRMPRWFVRAVCVLSAVACGRVRAHSCHRSANTLNNRKRHHDGRLQAEESTTHQSNESKDGSIWCSMGRQFASTRLPVAASKEHAPTYQGTSTSGFDLSLDDCGSRAGRNKCCITFEHGVISALLPSW